MRLRSAIRGQRPMTPTVTSWVWQIDSEGSGLDTIDNLCLREIKLSVIDLTNEDSSSDDEEL